MTGYTTPTQRPLPVRYLIATMASLFYFIAGIRAQASQLLNNSTISYSVAAFSGNWACSDTGAIDTGACPVGCRTSTIGDSMSLPFEGTSVWLSTQRDSSTSLVLSVDIDGQDAAWRPRRDNGLAGCYDVLLASSLNPTNQHVLTVTVLSAAPTDFFIFSGLTVAMDKNANANVTDSTSNVSGQTLLPPKPERAALIVAIIGGVLSFWLLVGLAIWQFRRVRRDQKPQSVPQQFQKPRQLDLETATAVSPDANRDEKLERLDRIVQQWQTNDETMVEAPDAKFRTQRSLTGTGTVETTSSGSSYPVAIDFPQPPGNIPIASPPAIRTAYTATNPFVDPRPAPAAPLAMLDLEAQRGDATVTQPLTTDRRPRSKQNETGYFSAELPMNAGGPSAPPLYSPSRTEYANGTPRRWM